MKITKKQLRSIINEVMSEDAFNLAAHGQQKKIAPEDNKKWSAVKADARMAADALQRLSDAIMDQDEEAAAKWLQKAVGFGNKAYKSLLGSN